MAKPDVNMYFEQGEPLFTPAEDWRPVQVWEDNRPTGQQAVDASGVPLWQRQYIAKSSYGGLVIVQISTASRVMPGDDIDLDVFEDKA